MGSDATGNGQVGRAKGGALSLPACWLRFARVRRSGVPGARLGTATMVPARRPRARAPGPPSQWTAGAISPAGRDTCRSTAATMRCRSSAMSVMTITVGPSRAGLDAARCSSHGGLPAVWGVDFILTNGRRPVCSAVPFAILPRALDCSRTHHCRLSGEMPPKSELALRWSGLESGCHLPFTLAVAALPLSVGVTNRRYSAVARYAPRRYAVTVPRHGRHARYGVT
jgi:hypothetical protein